MDQLTQLGIIATGITIGQVVSSIIKDYFGIGQNSDAVADAGDGSDGGGM